MESRARLRFHDGGLPPPQTQVIVRDEYGEMRLDCGWPEEQVAAEYDGAAHDDAVSRRADRHRHNRLRALGWEVFVFTDIDVYQQPQRMCALIKTALAVRGAVRRAS